MISEKQNKPGFYHIISHGTAAMSELDSLCSDELPVRSRAESYRLADMLFLNSLATQGRIVELGFELADIPTFLALKKLS